MSVEHGAVPSHAAAVSAARVVAVCLPQEIFHSAATGIDSGIDKRPVQGPLVVGPLGADGDHQGDRDHHGGRFKAIYAFARETREHFSAAEGRDLPDGCFGENLVTEGIDTDEVVVGQRWRVGSAVLEATCRRDPCRTFADWMGDGRWPRRFRDGGRCGAYFRVVQPGQIRAGDAIVPEPAPPHGVTVGETFRGLDVEQARALLQWAIDTDTVLYASQVRTCLGVIERDGSSFDFPEHLASVGR